MAGKEAAVAGELDKVKDIQCVLYLIEYTSHIY